MHYVKKSLSCALLIIIMVIGFALAGTIQVSAEAPGIIVVISSDTTWTKAYSPHTLTGPVFVSNGATLTIEAGATVDLNGYYITVNGTFVAVGASSEQIQIINGEKLEFTEFSNGWKEQTGSGCTIQKANVSCLISSSVSLKLDNNVLASLDVDDSVIVSNNEIGGNVIVGRSSVISNNVIGGRVSAGNSSEVSDNEVGEHVTVGGSSVICNNDICRSVSADDSTISNNIIRNGISGNSLTITDNVVTIQESSGGYQKGRAAISIKGDSSIISGNRLNGGGTAFDWGFRYAGTIGTIDVSSSSTVISDNVIEGTGIYLRKDVDSLVVTNNTINSGISCTLTTWEGVRARYEVNSFEISGNVITGKIEVGAIVLSVSNNRLIGNAGTGIEFSVDGTEVTSISDNIISGFFRGISGKSSNGILIERNLITNNTRGIECTGNNVRIQNNTITNNSIGIFDCSPSAIIRYNNIENNLENSIYLDTTSGNIDASYNWWGTTDMQAINLSIRDYKYDFDVGTVNFVPFLTEPNPEEMSTPIPEFPSWLLVPLFLVSTFAVIVVRKRLVG